MRATGWKIWLAGLGFGATIFAQEPASEVVRIEIDRTRTAQRIDGFGASSAWYSRTVGGWAAEQQSRMAEALFDTEKGLGLSILRLRIDPKFCSAEKGIDWEDPRAIAQTRWVSTIAQNYPAVLFMASPWTAPDWMKDNHSFENGGSLLPEHTGTYAAFLADYLAGLAERCGKPVGVLSVQNEPGVKTWESMEWTMERFLQFMPTLREALDQRGLRDVRLTAYEHTGWDDRQINQILADPQTRPLLDIACAHLYWKGDQNIRPFPAVQQAGLPLWMTEFYQEKNRTNEVYQILANARCVHEVMTRAEANAYLFWWAFAPEHKTPSQALIGIHETKEGIQELRKIYYGFGQYSRFVRPGFHRLRLPVETTETLLISAYADPHHPRTVVVAVNRSTNKLELELTGADSPHAVEVWRTSAQENLQPITAGWKLGEQGLMVTLPPESITTLVLTGRE
jgi:glucuronoarabinoxylan endo-1,4-beta-xylanase